MELLFATGLTHYVQREPLFSDLSFRLHRGQRLALTGRNGSGKSTLLKLLAGSLPPAEGTVTVAPGTEVVLISQADTEAAPDATITVWQHAALALERVRQLEKQLRAAEQSLLTAVELDRYAELDELFNAAGGYGAEATLRELLAAFGLAEASWERPFADLSGGERQRVRLAAAFAAPPGVLLLDEPDAALDDAALLVLGSALRRYRGAVLFSSHNRAFIDLVATHTARLQRGQLQLVRGGYSRLRQQLGGPVARRWTLETEGPGGTLLTFGPLAVPLGSERLLETAEHAVTAGQKIVLLGPNGSGKSTLLQLLADSLYAEWTPERVHWRENVHVEHLGQTDRGLQNGVPVRQQLLRVTGAERSRQLLALLGVPHHAWQHAPEFLSGGERARVATARLLALEADVLLLDEPTSDLDIAAIENLQAALVGTKAAVIIVTHDQALAETVADTVWAVEDGRLVEYRGGMEGYRAGRRRLERNAAENAVPAADHVVGSAPHKALEVLEDELAALDEALADPLRLSERQRRRLELRRSEVIPELLQLFDARLPPPSPRFTAVERGLRVGADRAGVSLSFTTPLPCRLDLLRQGPVAHLVLQDEAGSCLLPWVRVALLNAATRLAFYTLDVQVVQHAGSTPAAGLLLRSAGSGWLLLDRAAFLQLEGWPPHSSPGVAETTPPNR